MLRLVYVIGNVLKESAASNFFYCSESQSEKNFQDHLFPVHASLTVII